MFKTLLKIFIAFVIIAAAGYYSFNLVMNFFIHAKKEIILPELRGKSIESAVEELSSIGLGLKKEGEEFNNSVSPGVILRQSPPAGMNVRSGKVIKVTVSRGGEMIYVPNIVGQTVRAADIILKGSSLVMGEVTKKYSFSQGKGLVVSQDPQADVSADKDAVVNIVVSDGHPPAGVKLMPLFAGKNLDDAKLLAAENGLSADVRYEETQDYPSGSVIRQRPAVDSDLKNIKKVILVIAKNSGDIKDITFNYQLPKKGGNQNVRLVLEDDNGKKEIFNSVKSQGAIISVPIRVKGAGTVKVYINKKFTEDIQLH
ncbi:PASTA domain-containing protein [Endomicrobium proavitum]|uniref:Serine/threonine protein kinase with pasta sensors n=1 Tax=Endomicrobium proavitum TaxID=1408281 RepID=A0A0G3WJT5_9BACT|nr:PASTA domain-containing protein [Endomicrobium proavitum]AKL98553.1 serine/threonine protein kinase with pasta sensors [Endomicrobium proavitum]